MAVDLKRPVLESVCSFGGWGVSFIRPVLESVLLFVEWEVTLTRPMLQSVSSFGKCGVCFIAGAGISLVDSLIDGLCYMAPYSFVSGRLSGLESHLHTPYWNLSYRFGR